MTPVSLKTPRLSDKTFNNHEEEDDDEDVIILEESSTPKPSADAADVPVVKTECINLDQEEKQKEDSPQGGEPCSASTSEAINEQLSSGTQTELPQLVVKKEEVEDIPVQVPGTSVEKEQHKVNGVPDTSAELENELKSQLLLSNKEKEMYQSRCEALTKQVETLEQQLLEMNNKYVKKEMCHQATETDPSFGEGKAEGRSLAEVTALYEQALGEIATLKEQCNTLQNLKTECSKCADGESKSEVDEMAVQLDDVFRQLDKCTIERDRYKSEVRLVKLSSHSSHLHFLHSISTPPRSGWFLQLLFCLLLGRSKS